MTWELLVEGSAKTRGVAIIFSADQMKFSMGPMCHPMGGFKFYRPMYGPESLTCTGCNRIFTSQDLVKAYHAEELAITWSVPTSWDASDSWKQHIIAEWVAYWTGIPEDNIEVDYKV